MERHQLTELHFIAPTANIKSIREQGILSHNEVERLGLPRSDVSNPEVQARRARKRLRDSRSASERFLHDYANVYLNGRNPMLYVLRPRYKELCVLRVDPVVLDLAGAVIADGNASSDYTRFSTAPSGLAVVERDVTFARYWTHADYYAQLDHKRRMCAELLVPTAIPANLITGAFVSCDEALSAMGAGDNPFETMLNRDLFFNS